MNQIGRTMNAVTRLSEGMTYCDMKLSAVSSAGINAAAAPVKAAQSAISQRPFFMLNMGTSAFSGLKPNTSRSRCPEAISSSAKSVKSDMTHSAQRCETA